MASVVFLRGVNVGGHKAFRPKVLASQLADFDVTNVGAAGTFVVGKSISRAQLRAELERRLPFQAELMICRGDDVLELARTARFTEEKTGKDVRRFVSVMSKAPRKLPRLPISQPAGNQWQVKIVEVSGQFVLSLWRRVGRTFLYPNEVVEKQFTVPATTRSWNTILTIRDLLGSD